MESLLAKPKIGVMYIRVSSEEQVENFSLATQEDLCKREALKRGFQIAETFTEEGKSAKTIVGRPVLVKMLEYCRRNKKTLGAVFVYRLDRISRQTADYLSIRKKLTDYGITLISISEPTGNSPTERLVETMLAGFAQLDNDVRGERSRNGLRARFLSGLPTGFAPLGYKNENGYIVKDPETFELVKKSWELMETGTKSLSDMAKIMNEWGLYKLYKGKRYPLRSQTLSRVFRNKFYMGIITSKRYPEEIRGQYIPMITDRQFYKVQAVLDGRNFNVPFSIDKRNTSSEEFPLRRIIKCSKCGYGFTGAWSKGRHNKYAYYFCTNRCGGISVPVQEMHNVLLQTLDSVNLTKEGLDLVIFLIRKVYARRVNELQKRKQNVDIEMGKLLQLRQTLVEKNLSGVYSDEIFQEQNKIIEIKIANLQIANDDSIFEKYSLERIITFIKEYFESLRATYLTSNPIGKKVLLGSIFSSNLEWDYSGTLNRSISPMYQRMLDLSVYDVSLGVKGGTRTHNPLFHKQMLHH
jgi:site-specific DNA recombinase